MHVIANKVYIRPCQRDQSPFEANTVKKEGMSTPPQGGVILYYYHHRDEPCRQSTLSRSSTYPQHTQAVRARARVTTKKEHQNSTWVTALAQQGELALADCRLGQLTPSIRL